MPAEQTKILRSLFGSGGPAMIPLVESVIGDATKHHYFFMSDEYFDEWKKSAHFNIPRFNQLVAIECIDKAHLASVTSLVRTARWVSAICSAYRDSNYVAWATAARGLIESCGDILDGLTNIPLSLAQHQRSILACLRGSESTAHSFTELEEVLDHYVLAKHMKRGQPDVRRAKASISYIQRLVEAKIPKIEAFYGATSEVAHPSSASFDYLYEMDNEAGLRLNAGRDAHAIEDLNRAFPDVLPSSLIYSCNPPLLTLRVLHSFHHHPKLEQLRKLDWHQVPAWKMIEPLLKR